MVGTFNNSLDINAPIWQLRDIGNDAQLWSFIPINTQNQTYKIINSYSQLALTSIPDFNSANITTQTSIDSHRTDQIFQLQQNTTGCFIAVYPFVNYLTVNGGFIVPVNLLTWNYWEHFYPNCQQFIFEESSKKYIH